MCSFLVILLSQSRGSDNPWSQLEAGQESFSLQYQSRPTVLFSASCQPLEQFICHYVSMLQISSWENRQMDFIKEP